MTDQVPFKFYIVLKKVKKQFSLVKPLDKNIGKVGLQTAIGGVRLVDLFGEDRATNLLVLTRNSNLISLYIFFLFLFLMLFKYRVRIRY